MPKFDDCCSCAFADLVSALCEKCDDASQWDAGPDNEVEEVEEVMKIVDETKHNNPTDCVVEAQELA